MSVPYRSSNYSGYTLNRFNMHEYYSCTYIIINFKKYYKLFLFPKYTHSNLSSSYLIMLLRPFNTFSFFWICNSFLYISKIITNSKDLKINYIHLRPLLSSTKFTLYIKNWSVSSRYPLFLTFSFLITFFLNLCVQITCI